jgi:hypothetical protein
LREHLDDEARKAQAVDERRERTASVLATIPALVVAIVAGLVAFAISQSGPVAAAVIAVLGIFGVAASWRVRSNFPCPLISRPSSQIRPW